MLLIKEYNWILGNFMMNIDYTNKNLQWYLEFLNFKCKKNNNIEKILKKIYMIKLIYVEINLHSHKLENDKFYIYLLYIIFNNHHHISPWTESFFKSSVSIYK